MSMRTIVEFNHDQGHRIEDDPDGFVKAVMLMINDGVGEFSTNDTIVALERYGVRATPTRHHSEDRKVVTKYADYRF